MFCLDSRLKNDTINIGKLQLSQALLMNDSRYPWIILVPELDNVYEWTDLSKEQQITLHDESILIQKVLKDLYDGQSLNVGKLGNIVSQFHLHHIVRFENDPAWPGPVWGHSSAVNYSPQELESRISEIKQALRI
jgi:diadenosine tetraphosphate (Ap4A) HIT family hydrolase